jgi:hypothetical protein
VAGGSDRHSLGSGRDSRDGVARRQSLASSNRIIGNWNERQALPNLWKSKISGSRGERFFYKVKKCDETGAYERDKGVDTVWEIEKVQEWVVRQQQGRKKKRR